MKNKKIDTVMICLVALGLALFASECRAQNPAPFPPAATIPITPAAPAPAAPALPTMSWVGVGPSYNGSRWGASVAGDMLVSGKISLYGVVDWSFMARSIPTQTFSPGFNFDVLDWTWGKWAFRFDLLTLGGVTQTPTASLGNFTGGAHLGACVGKFCLGLAARQLTNPADPKEPRIYNLAAEWRFGK